jgi:uncharacterized protein (TIGR03435 family)
LLPGLGQQFEAADSKPNTSQQMPVRGVVLPGGQFRAINVPLKEITTFALDARDEEIAGAPGWVETEHYDVVGKAPTAELEGTFQRSAAAVEVMGLSYTWDDRFRKMVQAVLADRRGAGGNLPQRDHGGFRGPCRGLRRSTWTLE